jgi:hypothetical protein
MSTRQEIRFPQIAVGEEAQVFGVATAKRFLPRSARSGLSSVGLIVLPAIASAKSGVI